MTLRIFEKGDWVRAKSRDGELVRGYIESIDTYQDIMKIHVVESDNTKVVGKSIWLIMKYAEKLPEVPPSDKELLSLIDLALLTKDKAWFNKLTDQLNQSTPKVNNYGKKSGYFINGKKVEIPDNNSF